MTLPDRTMLVSAAFGLALASAPTSPVAAQDIAPLPKTDPTSIVVDDLKRDVEQMRKDLQALKAAPKPAEPADTTGLDRRLTGVESRLAAMESAVLRIEKRLEEVSKSTSASSPLSGGGPIVPPASTKATIRLVNEYQTDISMILNGVSYRLTAGEVRSVEVPSGSYSYELLAAGSRSQTSTVKDGETLTLRIR